MLKDGQPYKKDEKIRANFLKYDALTIQPETIPVDLIINSDAS